jgi:hypothetical protein
LSVLIQKIANSKIKLLFIVSLLVLAVIIVFTIFKPLAAGEPYTEVSRQSLFKKEDQWILQFDILNHEGQDVKYAIQLSIDGKDYREAFVVRDNGKFTYIHHFKNADIGNGELIYRIYRENENRPLEQSTYYLR